MCIRDRGRIILGLRAEKTWDFSPQLQFRFGTENRYDDVDKVGVTQTSARRFVSSFGLYSVKEASAALFGEATWEPLEGLRFIGGLRGDYYHADCLLYTSDAADERSSVDLGGRR